MLQYYASRSEMGNFFVVFATTKLDNSAPIVAAYNSCLDVLVCFMGATRHLSNTKFSMTFPSVVVDLK